MKTKTFTYQQNTWPLVLFGVLASLTVGLLAVYFYLISQSVWQVVDQELIGRQQAEIRVKLAELEAGYLHSLATLDLDSAKSLGLLETKSTYFVSRYDRLSSNVRPVGL